MTIKVVIIEDEDHAAAKLRRSLDRLDRDIEVLTRLEDVKSAVSWLKEHQVDLLFCDIHLGDAKGFEIFKQVDLQTPVVFTTAYDQYAMQAFEVNSVDYLLKPIRLEDLEGALRKFDKRSLPANGLPLDALVEALSTAKRTDYQKRFMVHFGEEIRTVEIDEVAYFFSEGKYTYLVTHDDKEYLGDYTLDELMEVLDPDAFFKISRQYIVSLPSIDKMYAFPKGRVKVILKPREKKEAIVSIERSPVFKKWLNK